MAFNRWVLALLMQTLHLNGIAKFFGIDILVFKDTAQQS